MSLALGIRYLCGRVTATHPADREQAEWPVHPDRVFMALVAAHFETGADPVERSALKWLEQRVPQIVCSAADRQSVVTSYVPVNDTSAPRLRTDHEPSAAQVKSGLALLPENRSRQPRQFPAVFPHDDIVYLLWDDSPPADVRDALVALCRKVTYLGHSASLVQMWLADDPPDIGLIAEEVGEGSDRDDARMTLVPGPRGFGRFRLRTPTAGRLGQLEAAYQRGQRPPMAIATGYDVSEIRSSSVEVVGSHFSADLIVLRQTDGPRFGLESTQLLTHHLRRKILESCPDPLPEWLSGHDVDNNGASRRKGGHMALVPLPHVGRRHADGHLLGLAIVLPRDVSREESSRCLRGLLLDDLGWPRPIHLTMGNVGVCELRLDDGTEYRRALKSDTWTGPAQRWATVTPICLDRHPRGENYWQHVELQIADGCERIGLPRPATVLASPSPMFVGVPHGRNMPRLCRKRDGGSIRHTHAVVLFNESVQGPIILGAGRYRGYGLCRPLENRQAGRR